MNRDAYQLQGQNGGTVNAGTNAQTAPAGKPWRAIQIVNDAVIAAIDTVSPGIPEDAGDLVALTLPAGLVIFGQFTSYTLTSGVVIAYF